MEEKDSIRQRPVFCRIYYFKAWFASLFAAVCGGDITSLQGTIQSPKYPQWYPYNKKCTWKITLPAVRNTFRYHDYKCLPLLQGCLCFVSLWWFTCVWITRNDERYDRCGSMLVSEQLHAYPSPTLLSVDCYWVRGGVHNLSAQMLRYWQSSIISAKRKNCPFLYPTAV